MKSIFVSLFITISYASFSQQNLDSVRMQHAILKDTNFLIEQLHPNLEYIHSNGFIETKTRFIESIIQNKITYLEAQFKNYNTINQDSTQINTGEVWVKGKFESTPFNVKLKFTSIYKLDESRLKLIYWQSTKLN